MTVETFLTGLAIAITAVVLVRALFSTRGNQVEARKEFERLGAQLKSELDKLKPNIDCCDPQSEAYQLYEQALAAYNGTGKGPYRIISIFERVKDLKRGLELTEKIRKL